MVRLVGDSGIKPVSNVNICIGLTPPPPRGAVLWTVMRVDRRPEAVTGCLEAPWITVGAGRHVHHRGDLRTEGERANTEWQQEKKLTDRE